MPRNARIWKDANDCNCAIGHCYHPWSKNTSGFNPQQGGEAFAADFQMQESSMWKTPSSIAPPDVDLYAAISSSHLMPNAVDLSDEIQGMISHVAMMSKRAKVNAKLSAYDPDPMSLDACKKWVNWEYPRQRNSWKQAIMNEIEASTPEHEEVDKRKCRMCLCGHKAIEGVHYNRIDAYAPVPTWSTIKL